MFVDYYKILEIDLNSSQKDIKLAFRSQAIKWHPDKNPNLDVTEKMQLINEAYLILKDEEARKHYDIEYVNFYNYLNTKKDREEKENRQNENKEKRYQSVYEEYDFNDEKLKNWMQNAKKQAVDLAKQTIIEMGELSVKATKEAGSKMIEMFVSYTIVGFIIFLIFKACN